MVELYAAQFGFIMFFLGVGATILVQAVVKYLENL